MVGALTPWALFPLATLASSPTPIMPSIGYERNSSDTVDAIPNVKGKVLPINVTSSLATLPATRPVPYEIEKVDCVDYGLLAKFVRP